MTAKQRSWLQQIRQHPVVVRLRLWWQKVRSRLFWLWQKIKQHPFITTEIIVVLIAVAFAVLVHIFGWEWTGFTSVTGPTVHPNEQYQPAKTLWDVMQLLIVPIILAIGGAIGGFWLNRIQKDREEKATQKLLLRKLYSDIVQAYNAAKRVRRLLRATAQCLSPVQKEIMITIEPYDKQMQALVDIQLQFETFIVEIKSNHSLFSGPAWQDTENQDSIISILSIIEEALNLIVKEYENLYKKRPNATPTLPISELHELQEFIGDTSKYNAFFLAAHEVMGAVLNLLTSE